MSGHSPTPDPAVVLITISLSATGAVVTKYATPMPLSELMAPARAVHGGALAQPPEWRPRAPVGTAGLVRLSTLIFAFFCCHNEPRLKRQRNHKKAASPYTLCDVASGAQRC